MLRHWRLSLVFAAAGCIAGNGQTISFMRQFSTPRMDRASAVSADASGIYVIGERDLSRGGAIRKYDSRGNELWTRELSDPAPLGSYLAGVAADGSGVYAAGYVRAACCGIGGQFIRRYSSAGDELWTHELEFLPSGGIAADAEGVYVAGAVFAPGTPGNFLRKYNAEGKELWTGRFRDPASNPYFGVVTLDATGIYVFGPTSVSKWDRGGSQLWTRQLNISTDYLLAAGAPAGFFLAGAANSPTLRKYDGSGNEEWNRPLDLSRTIYPGGLAADATSVYVAGTTDLAGPALPGQCRTGSGVDSFLRKYGADGALEWTREFSTSDAAWARGVAVNGGGIYVVGRTGSAVADSYYSGTPPAGAAFLAKFENSGEIVSGSRPRISTDCVVNAASYVGGGVAPGEMVTLFGTGLGPAEPVRQSVREDGRLETILSDTRILFNGVAAPLLYVSEKQSSAVVPYALAGRTAVDVQVEYRGVQSEVVTVPVLASRPGIFSLDGSGHGQALILNEDGSFNSPSNAAQRGSIITILGTGGGESAVGVLDGQIVSSIVPRTGLPLSVFFDYDLDDEFGNQPKRGEVIYAGGSAGSVAGLLEVKVRVPENVMVTGDAVPFALIVGSESTVYQVSIALR